MKLSISHIELENLNSLYRTMLIEIVPFYVKNRISFLIKKGKYLCKEFLVLIVLLFVLPLSTIAHSGGTDENGGHHCWTNCEEKGYEYGEYHYHNGDTSSSSIDDILDELDKETNKLILIIILMRAGRRVFLLPIFYFYKFS
ncbi:YHYH domain-containing protein [Bacillaceae bacterium S4-13-58]